MTRVPRTRIKTMRALTAASVLAAGLTAAVPVAAQAAVACNETALITAIKNANAAGGASLALTPGCTYTLTASHAVGSSGPVGLPIIKTVVALTGDRSVIRRSPALLTPAFRIAEVSLMGNLTLNSVTLSNGKALGAGGAILNYGGVTLTASTLTNNTATRTGGALSNADVLAPRTGATATFTNSTVSANSASGRGGGVFNGYRGTLTTTSSAITGNTSLSKGGGVGAVNATATTLTSTRVASNTAVNGAGGVFRLGGAMTITTSPITGNLTNNCVSSAPAVPSCTA